MRWMPVTRSPALASPRGITTPSLMPATSTNWIGTLGILPARSKGQTKSFPAVILRTLSSRLAGRRQSLLLVVVCRRRMPRLKGCQNRLSAISMKLAGRQQNPLLVTVCRRRIPPRKGCQNRLPSSRSAIKSSPSSRSSSTALFALSRLPVNPAVSILFPFMRRNQR